MVYCDTEWFTLEMNRGHSVDFETASKYYILDSFVDYEGYSISSKGFLPTVVYINSPIAILFGSLIPKMSMFTLAISYLTTLFALTHLPVFSCSCAILLFIASGLASIPSHIHNWVLFLLWPLLFILSGVISPLISVAYWIPTDLENSSFSVLFAFHTVHGILKARILKWFAIPSSSGPHFVRTLRHDLSILSGTTWHGS